MEDDNKNVPSRWDAPPVVLTKEEVRASLKLLSAADILATDDRRTIDVEVPEWGGIVRIRSLRGDEAQEYWDANKKDTAKNNAVARMLCRSMVGENGELLFTETDVAVLKKKSLAATMRVQKAILKLNHLDETEDEEKKD